MKTPLILPKFKNEDDERNFWSKIDLSDYFETSDAKKVSFPNLKPTSRPISIRLSEYLIDIIKEEANRIDISYQSLIKQVLRMRFLLEG